MTTATLTLMAMAPWRLPGMPNQMLPLKQLETLLETLTLPWMATLMVALTGPLMPMLQPMSKESLLPIPRQMPMRTPLLKQPVTPLLLPTLLERHGNVLHANPVGWSVTSSLFARPLTFLWQWRDC